MIAGGHEDIGAGVDGSVRELLEELSRTARFSIVVAADGTLVRMDRHDDEIRIFPRCADTLVDLGEILRIHGVLVGEGIRLPIFGGEQLDIGGRAAAVPGVEDAVDLRERLHCGRGHRDGHRQVKGIDAGASGRGALARQRVGGGAKGRGERDERHASGGAFEVLGCARQPASFTDPGMNDPRLIQPAARLPHSLEPQSSAWLLARDTIAKPMLLRSRATAGNAAFVQSPSQENGEPLKERGSKIVVSMLP